MATTTAGPASSLIALAPPADASLIIPRDPTRRMAGPTEGSVLLSVKGDVVLKLNSVSTLVWRVLDESKGNKPWLTVSEILSHLVGLLEGCLNNPVPLQIVRQDLERLLHALVQKNLLRVGTDTYGRSVYRSADGVSWSKTSKADLLATK